MKKGNPETKANFDFSIFQFCQELILSYIVKIHRKYFLRFPFNILGLGMEFIKQMTLISFFFRNMFGP